MSADLRVILRWSYELRAVLQFGEPSLTGSTLAREARKQQRVILLQIRLRFALLPHTGRVGRAVFRCSEEHKV